MDGTIKTVGRGWWYHYMDLVQGIFFRYFPNRQTRRKKEREIDILNQGNMSIGEYIQKN